MMPEPKTPSEVVAISHRAADEAGIPRGLLLACAVAESNLIWNARRPARAADDERFWPDVSGGPWQQTVRYDPDYSGGGGYPGPSEIERVLHLQYDVERSARVAAANLARKFRDGTETDDDENLIRDLFEYNWPAGAERPWTAEHAANYRRGLAEARRILGGPAMPAPSTPLPYNPDAPIDPQPDDWSCSIQAVQWLLRSIGRNPDASDPQGDPWLREQLVPSHVTEEKGLLDGSGRQLAQWITETYGTEMGFVAQASPVTFDDVAAGAGVNPTMVGGSRWNHWAGVRRLNADGTLVLANPSLGWMEVRESISREQWDRLGPWHAIWIDRMSTLPAPVPPAPPAFDKGAVIAALQAILARHDEYDRQIRADLAALIGMAEKLGD